MLNTVNIVNIHDKDGNKVDIKSEMESADVDDDIDNLEFSGKFCLPSLEIA